MGFKFPNSCENALVEVISDAAKGVFDSVFDGTAFENPMGSPLGSITDTLNATSLKLDELIAQAGDGELHDALGNVRDMLGIGADGEVIGGIMEQLQEFKSHSDMMSGVGNLDEFTERLGMAGSFDGAMQRLGRGEGAFGDIFRSFETGGQLLNTIQGQVGQLTELLELGLDDLDAGDLLALGSAIGLKGGEIVGEINLDNAAFGAASMLVKKLGIADMITDRNCYIKKLMLDGIGSSDLLEHLPESIKEQFGTEFDEQQQQAIDQTNQITADQMTASGIHDPVLAKIVGTNIVSTEENIDKVASRPVFVELEIPPREDITETSSHTTVQKALSTMQAKLIGSPFWEEFNPDSYTFGDEELRQELMKRLNYIPNGWWQWYRQPDIGNPTTTIIKALYWNSGLHEWKPTRIDKYTTIPTEVSSWFWSSQPIWEDDTESIAGFAVDVEGFVDFFAERKR